MSIFGPNIQFLHPELFLLLLVLPLAGWRYLRRRHQHYATLRVPSLQSVQGQATWRARLRAVLPLLRALAFAALVVALARPQEMYREETVEAEGIDIMLVLDLSSSMLAQDFKPDRLSVCKRVGAEFIDQRSYDRIGLAVFAGEAFTLSPLTTDHRVLKEFLAQAECGMLEDGTAIGMGLATAVARLEESEAKSKIVILLTDGVNNAGYISPLMAAQIAQQKGVKVYAIGAGTTGEALTPVSRRSDGRYIFGLAPVKIDDDLLEEIAEMTGGEYYRATSPESLKRIYDTIDTLEKTKVEVEVFKRYSEAFYPFVFLGILLLALEALLRYTILRTIP